MASTAADVKEDKKTEAAAAKKEKTQRPKKEKPAEAKKHKILFLHGARSLFASLLFASLR